MNATQVLAVRRARQHNHEANRYARMGFGSAAHDQRICRDRWMAEARARAVLS